MEQPVGQPAGAPRSREIGRRLRLARTERGLSLRALAARADVTASLLSQIETGRINPSVETLFAVAGALDKPLPFFFGHDEDTAPASRAPVASAPVVRRHSRSRIRLEHGVAWESLVPREENGLEFMEIHYPAGAVSSDRLQRHGGRDYGIVLSGRLTVRLSFSEYVLEAGDSVAFDATTPHQLRNDGDIETVAVWLVLERNGPNQRMP
ncbi:MAG: XRE family transcriptional regulator [Chloroflexota bacterium]